MWKLDLKKKAMGFVQEKDLPITKKDIYAFYENYGYGLCSRAEAQISQIKQYIGATLLM